MYTSISSNWSGLLGINCMVPGVKNVKHQPFVDPTKVLLPPLHIKFGIMNNVVKAVDRNDDIFGYLMDKFSSISEAMLKEDIFIRSQIRQLLVNRNCKLTLSPK